MSLGQKNPESLLVLFWKYTTNMTVKPFSPDFPGLFGVILIVSASPHTHNFPVAHFSIILANVQFLFSSCHSLQ